MNIRLKLTICLFVITISAMAQMTIEQYQELAVKNYPMIKQHFLIDETAKLNLSNASKSYLPGLGISARTTYQSDVTGIPESLETMLSQITGRNVSFPGIPKDQYQIVAELNQTLWDGGATKSQKKIINSGQTVEKEKLEVDLYTIKEKVNQLFFGILALNEQITQTEILQKELQRNYDNVSAYIKGGVANQSDLDLVRVEQLKTEQRQTELKSNIKLFKELLAFMTGQPSPENITLIKPEQENISIDAQFSERPEIDLFNAHLEYLESQKSSILSTSLPKFGLFAQGGYGNPGLNMFKPGFTTYYLLGARMSWNLSSLYTHSNNIKKTETAQKSIQIQKETFLYNNKLNLSRSTSEINKIREQLKKDEEIIELRKNIKVSAENKVANGTLTISDLLKEINAENLALQEKKLREIQLLQAIYNQKFITNK